MTETAASPPTPTPSTVLFVRPQEGRMLAGVCAGIAERWQLDVTLVRIIAAVLAVLSGVGLAAYVAAWLLTPSADGPAPLHPDSRLARAVSARGDRLLHRLPALVLIGLVALLLVGLAHHLWLGVPVGLAIVAALAVLLLGTRPGRWVAVTLAALLALAVAAVGVFGDHVGTRTYTVTSASDLQPTYEFGAGAVRLDLSQLTALAGRQDTAVRLGRGNVTITLPPDVPVVVHARTGVGTVTVDGHRVSGIDAEQTRTVSAATGTADSELSIDVTVGAGSVTVR